MVLSDIDSSDLFSLVCGKEIGRGQYRVVYESHLFPDCVVKYDCGPRYCNAIEYQIWQDLHDSKLSKWLAPVVWCSPRSSWLIMKRTEPIKQMPKKVPDVFCDTKADNWGMYQGRPVCHDYGNHRMFVKAASSSKLKFVNWT